MSSTSSGTSTASASSSASASQFQLPSSLKIVGIILAVASGLLIGTSFVFKKKGLLRSQAGHAAGEGVAYLKSPLWWTGMIMMILGELCNFAAYAFVEALVVTPMGALSVVISAILSSLFLNEKLTFFGWLGCGLCIIGSVIIALNGPQEQTVSEISEFEKLFIAPGFLAYISVLIVIALSIIFYFGPKHGTKSMLWYIAVCSTIGGISVSVTTGLGSAIVSTVMGHNQFKNWFIYFLIAFVAVTLVTEVFYLNKALALFNTAMVTPTYYVLFSFCSMVTTVVLFQGLKASASQILTIVFGFLTICVGITLLQMSKIDPDQLATQTKLDRRSTVLLAAARSTVGRAPGASGDLEKDADLTALEDPGIDALRGSFGTVGSIIRARSARRATSMASRRSGAPAYTSGAGFGSGVGIDKGSKAEGEGHEFEGLTRHQLYDAPMPASPLSAAGRGSSFGSDATSLVSGGTPRRTTIKFGDEDVVHSYSPAGGRGDGFATHERRFANPSQSTVDVRSPSPLGLGTTMSSQGEHAYVYPPSRGHAPHGSLSTLDSVSGAGSGLNSLTSVPPTPSTGATVHGEQSLRTTVRRADEPPAPRLDTRFTGEGGKYTDPFDTPTTPSMHAFPSSSDYARTSATAAGGAAPPASAASSRSSHTYAGSGGAASGSGSGKMRGVYGYSDRSPTVSAESSRFGEEEEEVYEREPRPSNASARRYPKGADDPDESVSLWNPREHSDEEEGEEAARRRQEGAGAGGIRLVQQRPRGGSGGVAGRF
ncbi:DUF803-domain-containing protein [Coniophora puteana RWD-64-598 SS2]|uniref:DUF803-domain-containing protein n=1 Tax=Coniophora puteana (strain RWD-64-598) TaxID=741705 RepID=A0A5M3MWF4_CONPW|nr:DUF803-domain-containing protein [Coniophora puteana RWD-64-598 SS2]EIW83483.1 DUF803-domain-containing protein [Coniophora puteana RWD-64-598 SS2]